MNTKMIYQQVSDLQGEFFRFVFLSAYRAGVFSRWIFRQIACNREVNFGRNSHE
jgi:hypothetical protein